MNAFLTSIKKYAEAAFSLLYVQTHEERRVIDEFASVVADQSWNVEIWHWSHAIGLQRLGSEEIEKEQNPLKVLEFIQRARDESVFILKDFGIEGVTRQLRDMLGHLEVTGKTIIFLSPGLNIPFALEKDITVVPFPLPTQEQLETIVIKTVEEQGIRLDRKIKSDALARIVRAAASLTANETKNVISMALAEYGELDDRAAQLVLNEKAKALKKNDVLHWEHTDIPIERLGGFGNVKTYLKMIAPIFWEPDRALEFGLRAEDFPRSILFLGPPGVGKSLAARIIANYLKIPCVRTNFTAIFAAGGGKVGAPEGVIDARNAKVEAMEPILDWWDEAEKGLAGASGKSEANPWEARVGGSILTWFEGHRKRILVAATVNKQELFAPEMLSRFQKVFFVDLPTETERVEVFKSEFTIRPVIKDIKEREIETLSGMTAQYSGREIRNITQLACQLAFSGGATSVGQRHLADAVGQIRPIAKIRKDEIERLRKWAQDYGVEWASGASDNPFARNFEIGRARKVKVKDASE